MREISGDRDQDIFLGAVQTFTADISELQCQAAHDTPGTYFIRILHLLTRLPFYPLPTLHPPSLATTSLFSESSHI